MQALLVLSRAFAVLASGHVHKPVHAGQTDHSEPRLAARQRLLLAFGDVEGDLPVADLWPDVDRRVDARPRAGRPQVLRELDPLGLVSGVPQPLPLPNDGLLVLRAS